MNEQILQLIEKEKQEKTGRLNLAWEGLTSLPEAITELTHLESLVLASNKIEDCSLLGKLTNLKSLLLSGNQIRDISFLETLNRLEDLDLSNNKISDIEPLFKFFSNDTPSSINGSIGSIIKDNPTDIPPEIISKGNEAIIQYWQDIEAQGKDYLYEAKLLIVGPGEAGKTTLARKISNINAKMPKKEDERTEGIDIEPIILKNNKMPTKSFQMNVWDFGGQEIYHSTHQFFLTKRSLYIIVNNTRTNSTDFNYWLQVINLFSDNSPVIIIQNQVSGSDTDLDLPGLQKYFSNIRYMLDADLSNINDGRVRKIIQHIGSDIQKLWHVGDELPKQWVAIRNVLQKKAKDSPYIKAKEFYKICVDNEVAEKKAMQRLSSLLHDLGVFLHFQDEPILGDIIILQNSWATKGVYKILDDKTIKKQKGRFSYIDVKAIWEGTDFEGKQDTLLQLMSKFELCYQIPYQKPREYLSPRLLPIAKPDYEWDDIDNEKDETDNNESSIDNLILHYTYQFMPKGLLERIIVRLHRYIKDINKYTWRKGCIFNYEYTNAEVIETYGVKKIEIRIKGNKSAYLSTIITKEIDELNASYQRLEVKKMIPCNCEFCVQAQTPHFYEYDKLIRRKENGKKEIECEINTNYPKLNIDSLLGNVFESSYSKITSIRELIKLGRIEDALFELQKTHIDDATLLRAQYSNGKNDYRVHTIKREEWDTIRQRIGKAILEIIKTDI